MAINWGGGAIGAGLGGGMGAVLGGTSWGNNLLFGKDAQPSPYGQMQPMQNPTPQLANSYYNQSGVSALEGKALQQGPSAWANLMQQRQGIEQGAQKENIDNSFAGQLAQARSNLAMRGGLRSGASENLQTAALRGAGAEQAKLGRQGESDRLGILTKDEEMKNQLLSQLPGAQNQGAATQAGIIQGNNSANQNAYDSYMKAYAGDQNANSYYNLAQQNRDKGLLGNLPIVGDLFSSIF